MGELTEIRLLVERYVADEVTRNGLAEVALRGVHARFREIVKARLYNSSAEQVTQVLSSGTTMFSGKESFNSESIRNAARELIHLAKGTSSEITSLSKTAKDISIQIDNVINSTSMIKGISALNATLSLANLAVGIAGFAAIGEKLENFGQKLDTIIARGDETSKQAKSIHSILKNDKIGEFTQLSREYTRIMSRIRDGKPINEDEHEKTIEVFEKFILATRGNLIENAIDPDLLLEFIFTLLPAYTSLISEWVRRYYYEMKKLPANYGNFLTTYDKLIDEKILNSLQDYYFIRKQYDYSDTMDICSYYTFLAMNGKVQIEEMVTMLRNLVPKEDSEKSFQETVEEFEGEMQSIAEAMADKQMVAIASSI